MADTPSPDSAADVKRWAENRRIANAVEVRELRTIWNTTEMSFSALQQLLQLYTSVNGWPPPDDAAGARDQAAVWEQFARLRSRLRP